jgi:hypothetical protein
LVPSPCQQREKLWKRSDSFTALLQIKSKKLLALYLQDQQKS